MGSSSESAKSFESVESADHGGSEVSLGRETTIEITTESQAAVGDAIAVTVAMASERTAQKTAGLLKHRGPLPTTKPEPSAVSNEYTDEDVRRGWAGL